MCCRERERDTHTHIHTHSASLNICNTCVDRHTETHIQHHFFFKSNTCCTERDAYSASLLFVTHVLHRERETHTLSITITLFILCNTSVSEREREREREAQITLITKCVTHVLAYVLAIRCFKL